MEKDAKMFLNQMRNIQPYMRLALAAPPKRWYEKTVLQPSKPQENNLNIQPKIGPDSLRVDDKDPVIREIYSTARVMPMMLTNKEPIVLPFDDVPGPRVLKYISSFRQYLSEMGTQLTVGALTLALNIG